MITGTTAASCICFKNTQLDLDGEEHIGKIANIICAAIQDAHGHVQCVGNPIIVVRLCKFLEFNDSLLCQRFVLTDEYEIIEAERILNREDLFHDCHSGDDRYECCVLRRVPEMVKVEQSWKVKIVLALTTSETSSVYQMRLKHHSALVSNSFILGIHQ